ncbi:MAG: tetratricopeptide repeat protein [Candidatus Heimdallarchaeota archaeon]
MTTVQELTHVEELITQNKYKKALHAVNQLKKSASSSDDWQYVYQLLAFEVEVQGYLGDYEALTKLIDQVMIEGRRFEKPLRVANILGRISYFHNRMGKYRESLDVAVKAENLLETVAQKRAPEVKHTIGRLINQKGSVWRIFGECEKALGAHRRGLALFKEIGDKSGIVESLQGLSFDYQLCKANYDRGFEYAKQALSLAEEIGDKKNIATALNRYGDYFAYKRDDAKALKYYRKSLALREEIGDNYLTAGSHNNLACFYTERGDLDLAMQHFQESLALSKEIGAVTYIARLYGNIANVYIQKGEYSRALEYLKQSLATFKERGGGQDIANQLTLIGDVYRELGDLVEAMKYYQGSLPYVEQSGARTRAVIFESLGLLYWQKGDLDTGLRYLQDSLALVEDLGVDYLRMNCLFSLVRICLDLNNLEDAHTYFYLLNPDPAQPEDKLRSQLSRVAEALILKTSARTINRGKAEELLQGIVNEEIVQHKLTVLAMLHLCDLQIQDLKSVDEDVDLYQNVQALLERLIELAKSHHSFRLLTETYVLQSKLALVNLDISKAQTLLGQARLLAEEKGLQVITSKITDEEKRLTTQMDKWTEFIEKKVPLSEVREFIRIDEFIDQMVQNRLFPRDLDVLQYAREARLAIQKEEQES